MSVVEGVKKKIDSVTSHESLKLASVILKEANFSDLASSAVIFFFFFWEFFKFFNFSHTKTGVGNQLSM